jgi:hypothetical protein
MINYKHSQLRIDETTIYGEVQFYLLQPRPCALISLYSEPEGDLLAESYGVLWACRYHGNESLKVVDVTSITSVVSMQPLPPQEDGRRDLWFVVEKDGLEDIDLVGVNDDLDDGGPDEI